MYRRNRSTEELMHAEGFDQALRVLQNVGANPAGIVEIQSQTYLIVDISSGTDLERRTADYQQSGKSFKAYRIAKASEPGAILGRGSFGVVKRAETKEGLQMAVKIQTLKTEDWERMQNETAMSRRAGMKCYDFSREILVRNKDGQSELCFEHYLVMPEYRKSLYDHLNERPSYSASAARHRAKFDINARLDFAIDLFFALHRMHQKGIVHCDIKPANIFIDASGRLQLADFGCASTDLHKTIESGTAAYLPQQGRITGKNPRFFSWSDVDAAKLGDRVGALLVVCGNAEMRALHATHPEFPSIFDADALNALPKPLQEILIFDEDVNCYNTAIRLSSWQHPQSCFNGPALKTRSESELFFAAVLVLYKNLYNEGCVPEDKQLTQLFDELRGDSGLQERLVDAHFKSIQEYDLADNETLTTRERSLEHQHNGQFIERVKTSLEAYKRLTTHVGGLSALFCIRDSHDMQLVSTLESLMCENDFDTQPEKARDCVDNLRLALSQSFNQVPRETPLKSCLSTEGVLSQDDSPSSPAFLLV